MIAFGFEMFAIGIALVWLFGEESVLDWNTADYVGVWLVKASYLVVAFGVLVWFVRHAL